MFAGRLSSDIGTLNKINAYLGDRAGKQLRPMLTLLCSQALRGFCNENVIRCAAAVELMHTATLLHDDVADDSLLRRGSPTIRALYSPTASVLVGDFWLSRAIETIVGYCDQRVIMSFAKCLQLLAEGEILQIEKASTLDTTEEDYRKIIYRKTSALFVSAMESAAFSINATDSEIAGCREYAAHLGQAFQIMDDIFDYLPSLNTGKPVGQDILERKMTLPLMGMLKNAPSSISDAIIFRMKAVGKDPAQDERLAKEAIELVRIYGGVEYAREVMEREIESAIEAISFMADSQAKDYLIQMARYMTVRSR